jgi:hypothetical protein
MNLRLDWATHQAAKYAVEHWHYSKSLPGADKVYVGVWEDDIFIGCIIFSRGATPHLGSPFGLTQFECTELTRIALNKHITPVSRIISIAIKFLKKQCPGLKLIVSFADPTQNHHGGVYQAGNWVYCGQSQSSTFYKINGKITHPRTLGSRGLVQNINGARMLDSKAKAIKMEGKHRYLMPLDESIKPMIQSLSKPYPKRPKEHEPDTIGIRGRCDSDPDAPNLQDEVAE